MRNWLLSKPNINYAIRDVRHTCIRVGSPVGVHFPIKYCHRSLEPRSVKYTKVCAFCHFNPQSSNFINFISKVLNLSQISPILNEHVNS